MAILKDTLIQGACRVIGDAYFGTIKSGVWNGSTIANSYLTGSGAITIAGRSVSLGGSISLANLRSDLGLGELAYINKGSTSGTYLKNDGTWGTPAGTYSLPARLSEYLTADSSSATYNGFGRISSNSPFSGISGSSTDCMTINTAYSSSWAGLLATDYRTSNIAYRAKNNGTWTSWAIMLNNLNYTSYTISKSGDTMTGALTVPSISVTGAATFSLAINGSILGNAATASRLLNSRTIWGLSFDGTANITGDFVSSGDITLANAKHLNFKDSGGTARNIVLLNASNHVILGYGMTSNYSSRTELHSGAGGIKLTVFGTNVANVKYGSETSDPKGIFPGIDNTYTLGNADNKWYSVVASNLYGTLLGKVSYASSGMWIKGRDNATVINSTTPGSNVFIPVAGSYSKDGFWCMGTSGDTNNLYFEFTSTTNYNTQNNNDSIRYALGLPTTITSNGAYDIITSLNIGSQTVSTANYVKTTSSTSNATRYLTFVDSNNSSATAETVYTNANLTFNPSTGKLKLPADKYTDDGSTGALDLSNSNIVGVNAIYFADYFDNAKEGINFKRSSGRLDTLVVQDGKVYLLADRSIGGTDGTVIPLSSNLVLPRLNPYNITSLGENGLTGIIPPYLFAFMKGKPLYNNFPDNLKVYNPSNTPVSNGGNHGYSFVKYTTGGAYGTWAKYVHLGSFIYYDKKGPSNRHVGFYFGHEAELKHTYVAIFCARVQEANGGYSPPFTAEDLSWGWANNSVGTGYNGFWITDNVLSDKWQWYAYIVNCGWSGTPSTTNHFYIECKSTANIGTYDWAWYNIDISFAQVYDITNFEYLDKSYNSANLQRKIEVKTDSSAATYNINDFESDYLVWPNSGITTTLNINFNPHVNDIGKTITIYKPCYNGTCTVKLHNNDQTHLYVLATSLTANGWQSGALGNVTWKHKLILTYLGLRLDSSHYNWLVENIAIN